MAPALTVTPCVYKDDDQVGTHRRRAFTSVGNLSHMEEDEMGLQNQPNLAKDSQEMEQILVDLGNSDLVQGDLLQAIKTLESGGESLATTDPVDGMFPLSGFENEGDSESDAAEDKIRFLQVRLERRCAFLQRRLRILQARTIGKRISEEVTQTFEKCIRGARKDGAGRSMGVKALLKRVETTSALQASAASRSVVGPKYYKPGTSKGDANKSATIGIVSGTLTGLEDTAGALRSHLSVVKHELDSDATVSSSGAESNDEAVQYNNPHQQHMPIEKRALWSWQRNRASIASRWGWLQAQIQELEYKIRQHTELHKEVREAKGRVQFENEPIAYEGLLPGNEPPEHETSLETCARVRPLRRETFKKRKLLQMHNLHIATTKAAKPSDIKCGCRQPLESCAVCTGRAECTQPATPLSASTAASRLALVDPSFHPVLSDVTDIPASIHVAALTSRAWFRTRVSKSWRGAHHSGVPRAPHSTHSAHNSPHVSPAAHSADSAQPLPKQLKKNPTKMKRGRPPLSRKIKEKEREEEASGSGQERWRGRTSTESRASRTQFDIDNIVIPQSIAANTRPEILTYKEIVTPKWRVLEIPEIRLNNGISHSSHRMSVDSEEEDMSEACVAARHQAAEVRERARYLRTRRTRRNNDAHTSPPPPPTPPPASSAPPPPPTPPVPHHHESVRPYSPREFPLSDEQYLEMLACMPADAPSEATHGGESDGDGSSLSALSPTPLDADDPDDAEWEPTPERTERRRSTLR